MYTTGEYYHLIFPYNFSFGDYLFVYDAGKNNVVGLIHPIPDIEDKLEDYTQDKDVIDTTGYNMKKAMERKNGNICYDYDYRFGKEHTIYDDNYSLYDNFEQNTQCNIYI